MQMKSNVLTISSGIEPARLQIKGLSNATAVNSHPVALESVNHEQGRNVGRMGVDSSGTKKHHAWLHLKRGEKSNTISSEQAAICLIKGLLGTGIFALPQALKNAGLWTGFALIAINNIIAIYCVQILAKRAQKYCFRKEKVSLDYGDVVELTFEHSPQPIPKYAKTARIITSVFICLAQLGICAAYLTFTAINFQQAFDFVSDHSVKWYMTVILPFLIVAVSLRHLKYISILAYFGNPLQFLCLGITLYYIFRTVPNSLSVPAFAGWGTLPLAFGTIMFSFEAITLILPVENRTRDPAFFLAWNGVLNCSCMLVTWIYLAFGFFGYISFGEDIKDSITLNLPHDEPLARVVRGSTAIAVALSYPLQYHVPMEMVAKTIKERFRETPKKRMIIEYSIRYVVTLLIYAFSMLVSSLGLIISLVGALAGTTLALLIPPIMDLVHLYGERSLAKWYRTRVVINVLVFLYGVIGFVSGTAISIYDIVKTLSGSSSE